MKNHYYNMPLGLMCTVTLSLFLGQAAIAAPKNKIDICHKPGKHNQKILKVNTKSSESHFGHGDHLVTPATSCDVIEDSDCDATPDTPTQAEQDTDCENKLDAHGATCDAGICVEPPPEPMILARAWTDIDNDREYNAAAGDVLIAQLEDRDSNGVVSENDAIITYKYPKNLTEPFDFASFNITEYLIQSIEFIRHNASIIEFRTDSVRYFFRKNIEQETYSEGNLDDPQNNTSIWHDQFGDRFNRIENIKISEMSPSNPQSGVSTQSTTRIKLSTCNASNYKRITFSNHSTVF